MFSEGLRNERAPLVSHYGAIAGLQELGSEVIKTFIIPNLKAISVRYSVALFYGEFVRNTKIRSDDKN
jgi:transcription initiation factor TFIID subunit 6